ncbi:universal stress protein [Phytoactinopolyspora limicola]|uniref:universal stress protein n=1 Tax=Phytoactinopolyspora limicola TaxID=2715536 RepID=UPI00140B723E|nr:universal stress protein [Phytoactinopolyspora limicola]
MGRIVVGVDGSRDSEAALFWAAEEARLRGDTLAILYAVHTPVTAVPFGGTAVLPPTEELKSYGANLLDVAATMVRRGAADAGTDADAEPDDVQVTTELVVQPPVMALLAAAKEADLVVLGSRGLGTVGSAFLGSVSTRVASRADCPTIVVPVEHAEYRRGGSVVVGVDGDESDAAFRFAVAEAERRGTTVEVVHTYWLPMVAMPIEGANITGTSATYGHETAEERLQAFMDRNQHVVPDTVTVKTQVVLGDAAEVLGRMSEDAALVVVGSRGRGPLRGMLLGSVSQRLLHRVHGPVAVVHDVADPDTP